MAEDDVNFAGATEIALDSNNKPTRHFTEGENGGKPFRIVLIAGFETFNRELYRRAADQAAAQCPGKLDEMLSAERRQRKSVHTHTHSHVFSRI